MSFKEKFTNFFMLDDDDFDDNSVESAKPNMVVKNEPLNEAPHHSTRPKQKKSGGLSLVSSKSEINRKTRIKIIEPRLYSEVKDIADIVLSNQSVIINFRRMENDQAKKVIDFMMGTTYAADGDIQKIGDSIFLCTPSGVEIDVDELSSINTNDRM